MNDFGDHEALSLYRALLTDETDDGLNDTDVGTALINTVGVNEVNGSTAVSAKNLEIKKERPNFFRRKYRVRCDFAASQNWKS